MAFLPEGTAFELGAKTMQRLRSSRITGASFAEQQSLWIDVARQTNSPTLKCFRYLADLVDEIRPSGQCSPLTAFQTTMYERHQKHSFGSEASLIERQVFVPPLFLIAIVVLKSSHSGVQQWWCSRSIISQRFSHHTPVRQVLINTHTGIGVRNNQNTSTSLPPTMQTRDEFLATGLVPELSKAKVDDVCPICYCDFDTPVRTPCSHLFCDPCLVRWLKTPLRNTCPICKHVFYEVPIEERISPDAIRQRNVAAALEASNLISRQPPYYNYGFTDYNVSALMRASASATWSLGQGALPAPGQAVPFTNGTSRVAGPCIIDIQNIAPAFIAMANLLPALADAQGTPWCDWTPTWRATCEQLWSEIKALQGRKADAMVLPSVLKKHTRQALQKRDPSFDMRYFQYPLEGWIRKLLDWVAFTAWKAFQEKEKEAKAKRETKKKRKEARQEPKMRSGCGTM